MLHRKHDDLQERHTVVRYSFIMSTLHHGPFRTLNLWWRALFDPRTPLAAKILVVMGLVYGISPLDIIPDLIPLLGQIDDLGVLLVVLIFFLRMTQFIRADLRKRDSIQTTAKHSS
jgi:uncharacterized membrane protein YkvA (DUF1232 family)